MYKGKYKVIKDFSKITKNEKVIELLKKRREIELEIHSLDENALINYEIEML